VRPLGVLKPQDFEHLTDHELHQVKLEGLPGSNYWEWATAEEQYRHRRRDLAERHDPKRLEVDPGIESRSLKLRTGEARDPVVASVLFMDLVGNSQLSTREQRERVQRLSRIVRTTKQVKQTDPEGLILRPAGDGIALVFFGSPVVAVRCAVEIARATQARHAIRLRMGINLGLVHRTPDINGQQDVIGDGINMAQRVMDCGNAGHILLSRTFADVLRGEKDWNGWLHDVGERSVKHNVIVNLVNLWHDQVGNRSKPKRITAKVSGKVIGFSKRLPTKVSLVLGAPKVPFKHGQNADFFRKKLLKTTGGFVMRITVPTQTYWRCGFVLSQDDYIRENRSDIDITQRFLFHIGQGLPTIPPLATGLTSQFYSSNRGETPIPVDSPSPVEIRVRFNRRRRSVSIDVGGEHYVRTLAPSYLRFLYILAWADHLPPCRIPVDLELDC